MMKRIRFWQTAVMLILLMGLGYLWLASLKVAKADLPPRPNPEPTATAVPATPTPQEETAVHGAQIRLVVPSSLQGTWTTVQWQDFTGGWHDVTGWQGELDNHGLSKTWWVGPEHYGEGPFRWQVLEDMEGALIAESEFFDLPDTDWQVKTIYLSEAYASD